MRARIHSLALIFVRFALWGYERLGERCGRRAASKVIRRDPVREEGVKGNSQEQEDYSLFMTSRAKSSIPDMLGRSMKSRKKYEIPASTYCLTVLSNLLGSPQ